MRRHVAFIIALFYLAGTAGIPVAAYSCVETGEAGVAAYLAASPASCYADSCCDGEEDQPNLRFESDAACCDLDVNTAPESNRLLVPGQKYGQAHLLAQAHDLLKLPRSSARVVSALPPVPLLHASINLPLLV